MRLLLALAFASSLAAAHPSTIARGALSCVEGQTPVAIPTQAPALPWIGSADAIAEYLKTAKVRKIDDIPVGVTRPRRAVFEPGGLVGSAVIKNLRPGRKGGYWESYQSEIAAYELDRMLDLNMVPPTVEKRVDGEVVSAQMFVENCVWLKELKGQSSTSILNWNRQVHRQRAFDNLIANIDRNEGNLLVYRTPMWHLVLVDHSRAFTSSKKMIFQMSAIDRAFFEKLKTLDKPSLEARLGRLMIDGVDEILQRRDAIVAHFDKLAKEKGEAAVFIP